MELYAPINQLLNRSSYFYTIAIGLDSHYSFVSSNYDRNFALDKSTLKGQHFSVTLHPEDVKICEETGPKCFEAPGQLFPVTLRKHDGNGGFVTTQWEMQAMFDADGVPQGIFCIGYNITEFVDTKSKLDHAETQLDQISFIQSHGVRKPLANILGIAKLIAGEEDKEGLRQLAQLMERSADELDQIIKEISTKASDQMTKGSPAER